MNKWFYFQICALIFCNPLENPHYHLVQYSNTKETSKEERGKEVLGSKSKEKEFGNVSHFSENVSKS